MGPTSETNTTLTAVPRRTLSDVARAKRATAVLAMLGVAAAMGVLSTFAWASATVFGAGEPVLEVPDEARGRAVAETAVLDWLAGRASLVPTTAGVDADFSKLTRSTDTAPTGPLRAATVSWQGFELVSGTIGGTPMAYELHTLLVRAGSQSLLVSVPVSVVTGAPLLAGLPAIEPGPTSDADASSVNWSGLPQVERTDALRGRVQTWASAFASGDAAALRAVTGDPDEGTYRGLGGFTAEKVMIEQAVSVGQYALVRVHVTLRNTAVEAGFVSTAAYDLLVAGHGTQLPSVVAWGPAGSGPNLAPYLNAVRPDVPADLPAADG